MKVKLGQFEYETTHMSAYRTGASSIPVIYVNENGAAFVQTVRPHWPEPKVRYVGRAEALRLAAYYNLAELTDRLSRRNGPSESDLSLSGSCALSS